MPEGPIDIKTNIFQKRMVKDLNNNFQGVDTWSNARNAQVHTDSGDLFTISNEQSNTLCYDFGSIPLGQIKLRDNRLFIILLNGEFGILNTVSCTYEKLFDIDCKDYFTFTKRPIVGRSRLINDTEEYVVFGNEDIPISEINLSKIPYKFTLDNDECQTKRYTKEIDCEQLFQFKNSQSPCISSTNGNNKTGNLPNGSYAIAFSYLTGGQKSSNYTSLSTPIHIYNENRTGGSIELNISNLDRNQEQYQILLIANTSFNGQEYSGVNNESYFTFGPFYTSQTQVSITDLNGQPETLSSVISETKPIKSVGNISGNADYLLYSDIHYSEPIDYQLQAMNIGINYVIKQVPYDHYKHNSDFGYFGDENYAPAIVWHTKKGEKSFRYHIPGPKKTSKDSSIATGENVYELDKNLSQCDVPEKVEFWQAENTAGRPIPQNNDFFCNERIIAIGEMGYSESTELYPDNTLLYGEDACTPVRFPRFPDETKVKRFEYINGKLYINIRLWQFTNIEHPKGKNGKYRTDIAGYEIVRQTRQNGNKTVLATGYLSNIRGLQDLNRNILYQNYPFNDQSPDSFHSLTDVTSRNDKEQNFEPLTTVYKNRFSFYSPDANYGLKTALGQELKILTEERANTRTTFEPVYKHPKAKLITNTALYLSALLGLIQAYLEINGKIQKVNTNTRLTTASPTVPGTTTTTSVLPLDNDQITTMDTLWSKATTSLEDIQLRKPQRILFGALQTIAKVVGFTTLAAQNAQIWLDIVQKIVSPQDYAYQSNTIATFVESKPINKRRFVKDYQYIQPSNTQLKDGFIFNNEKSNSTIYVEVNKDVPTITYQDNSNRTISEADLCNNPRQSVEGSAAMYYTVSKQPNRNQYGALDSGVYVKVQDCPTVITFDKSNPYYNSPVLAGGDCIVTRTSQQTKRFVFSQDLTSPTQDEQVIDYKQYRNLGYPRFWYNSQPYEVFDIISSSPSQGKLPAQRHNLDCRKNSRNLFSIKNEYIYTSINGVIDYIVETDANLNFREQTDLPHYSDTFQNLSDIFRSDRLSKPELFKLNPSFFHLETNKFFTQQQPADFDPSTFTSRDKNAIVYSLPASKNQKVNNWKTFLPLNYYSFDNLQFGNLVGVHQLDADRIIFLFDKSSPFISIGQSELQTTSGETITLGDGGLFARRPRELQPTDVFYGATQSPYAFSSNPFGYFYPSASQGSLFQVGEGLKDVTQQGIHFWSKEFFKIRLRQDFPNYTEAENPLGGVGFLSVYDKDYGTLYITKRDFVPAIKDITYNTTKRVFEHNGITIELSNPDYFRDISFTISYRPQNEGFISFHDWHPDNMIQLENHFMTTKGSSIWRHNEDCQSYCNFYSVQYPFSIRAIVSYGQQINILDSFEYQLEAYHHINNCLDKYHVLSENFDTAQVSNSEQHSGVLNLTTKTEIRAKDLYNYPKVLNNFTTELLCIKKENRYRFNDFKNIVRDRGEQTRLDNYIINNDESGYKRKLYTQNLDTKKKLSRMRHSYHEVELTKLDSNRTQLILKFLNSKINNSYR